MLRSLSVEILKPVSPCTWDQLGTALRLVGRACTAGANLAQILLIRADHKAFETVGYQKEKVRDENGKVQVKDRVGLPKNKQGKYKRLPALGVAENKALGTAQNESYHYFRQRFPFVNSSIASNVTKNVYEKYKNSRFGVLTGQISVPTYRKFPITTNMASLAETENEFVLTVPLLTEASTLDCPKRVQCILRPNMRGRDRKVLSEIISGQRPIKTIRIVKSDHKKKWFVQIPFEVKPHQYAPVEGRVLRVFPERGSFLLCECRTHTPKPGETPSVTDVRRWRLEYQSIATTRHGIQNRVAAISAKYKQDVDTAAVGHGRKRAIKNKQRVQSKLKRAQICYNRQWAAAIIKQAVRWQCQSILYTSPAEVEKMFPGNGYCLFLDKDGNPSWPWYNLELCIRNKAEECGIKFEKTSSDDIKDAGPEAFARVIEENCPNRIDNSVPVC